MQMPPEGNGPQPYANYPRARPPRIHIDMIGDAFQVFAKYPKVWALAALPFAIVLGALTMYSYFGSSFGKEQNLEEFFRYLGINLLVMVGQQLLLTVVTLFALAGLTRMAMRQLDGLPIQPSDAYKVGNRIVPLVIASIIISMLSTIAACFCVVPYFIVMGLCLLVVPIIVIQGAGPLEAIGRSVDTLKGHLWPATGIALVLLILSGIGGSLCIGFLVMLPGIAITFALIYREFFPNPTATDDV